MTSEHQSSRACPALEHEARNSSSRSAQECRHIGCQHACTTHTSVLNTDTTSLVVQSRPRAHAGPEDLATAHPVVFNSVWTALCVWWVCSSPVTPGTLYLLRLERDQGSLSISFTIGCCLIYAQAFIVVSHPYVTMLNLKMMGIQGGFVGLSY